MCRCMGVLDILTERIRIFGKLRWEAVDKRDKVKSMGDEFEHLR